MGKLMDVLRLNNVKVAIGEREVLQDFSLEIKPKEIHVLMGQNGAGKSSLAKAIVGHPDYKITHGEAFYCEERLETLSVEQRARKGIFMTFQDPCEIEGLTVANFLRTAIHNFPDNPISQYSASEFYNHLYKHLEQVGLSKDFTSRYVHKGFSGGEKKRLEMLQLLLFQPKLAILDEVDSGLDLDALKIVVETVKSLRQNQQTSFLVVTHSLDFIKSLAVSYIHLLKSGQLVCSGKDEIIEGIAREGYQWSCNR